MDAIYENVGCQDKTKLLVENSGHVITRDLEKTRVAEAIIKFIHRISAPAHE
jgi:esterase/lipase